MPASIAATRDRYMSLGSVVDHMAIDDVADLRAPSDARTLQRGAGRHGAQRGGGRGCKAAARTSDRGARAGQDDDFVHGWSSPS